MRLLYWVIAPPLMVAAILFAISNRQQAEIHLWSLPYAIELPVYLVALGSLVVGFFIGALAMWYNDVRRRAR